MHFDTYFLQRLYLADNASQICQHVISKTAPDVAQSLCLLQSEDAA